MPSGMVALACGVGLSATPLAGGDVSIDIRVQADRVEITAQGITGERVNLDVSKGLNTWAVYRGIILSPEARARAREFPGWTLPISSDGTVTLVDSRPRDRVAGFYRVRSPGPGWSEARQKWESLSVREYRYHFRRSCFCFGAPGDGIVHVKDGKVVEVEELNSPRVPPGPVAGDPTLYPTIDGLFDLLDQFVRDSADVLQFDLDPDLGMPTLISVDRLLGAIDDEVAYSASEFQRIE